MVRRTKKSELSMLLPKMPYIHKTKERTSEKMAKQVKREQTRLRAYNCRHIKSPSASYSLPNHKNFTSEETREIQTYYFTYLSNLLL